MTIKSLDRFVGSLWDWAILDGCFGTTRIRPTDVDGMVESNGHFLVLEAKHEDGGLKQGQAIMFERLRRQGRFTILVLWGPRNTPQYMQLMTADDPGQRVACDLVQVRQVVSEWFENTRRPP